MVKGQGSMVNDQSPVGQPVLFYSGNMTAAQTRSGEPLGSTSPYYHGMSNTSGIPYMAQDGRFVCTMYYHAKATDTDASNFDIKDNGDGGTMTTTWLKVNNNVGNSVYWNKEYTAVDASGLDDYGFDKNATMLYWQNRLTHAFLALADYNKLSTNTAPTSSEMTTTPSPATAQGKLKLYPYWDKDFSALPTLEQGEEHTQAQLDAFADKLSDNRYANTYDLTRKEIKNQAGEITGYEVNTIDQQPDPILALTIMKPAGATQEANRVRLYFKHQFSLIQVNVKGADDNSADITAAQIEGVELLGVSTEGYVCNRLNADGTVGAATAKEVNRNDFTDAELDANKWGTSFQMFDMAPGALVDQDGDGHDDRYAIGFLKSFNAIAFGQLWAIRITWNEGSPPRTWTKGGGTKYVHVSGDNYEKATGTYYMREEENGSYTYTEITNLDEYTGSTAYTRSGDSEPYTYTEVQFWMLAVKHVATFEVPQTNEITTAQSAESGSGSGSGSGEGSGESSGEGSGEGSSSSSEEEKPVVKLRDLQSGMKYIYNLELRRGTLAIIRTEILPWEQKEELVYGTDGTIIN